MDINEKSLQKHYDWQGKLEVVSRVPVKSSEDLSLAYTPGVAEACREITRNNDASFSLTRRHNLVAVITDGSAVLGLGDIGPEAAMPVMEGKCVLFKEFADVDAFPICLNTKDTEELVRTIYLMSGSFGGINLEDIAAPRCFEIERRLKELCDIPVFHDDQHGTAIVVGAALINALKLADKNIEDIKCVINGAGAAGTAICEHLMSLGVKNIIMCDKFGIIYRGIENLTPHHKGLSEKTNQENIKGTLADALVGADVFVGVSAPNVLTEEMVIKMAQKSIVFPMANPVPEIMPDRAKKAGAFIVGTGRSDFPNQINNVLAFPGIFKGALESRASDINKEMQVAATYAIANVLDEKEITTENILPKAFDKRITAAVTSAVIRAARQTGVAKK